MQKYGLVCEVAHEGEIRGCAAFPAIPNAFLTASRDHTVKLWIDSGNGNYEATHTFVGHSGDVYAVGYLKPDGDRKAGIVTASRDKTAIVWDIETANPLSVLSGHEADVVCMDTSPDGNMIVTGSYDKKAIVWDAKTGKQVRTLQHDNAIRCVKWLSNGTILTGGDSKLITVWSTSGDKINTLRNHKSTIRGFAELPIGFASASSDETLNVFTLNGDHLMNLAGHQSFVYSVAPLPGSDLCSASEDSTVRVWTNGECAQTITHPTTVWAVCTLENGDIVSACADNYARVWSQDTSKVKQELQEKFHATVASKAVSTKAVGGVELNKLPGPEALAADGDRDGQIRMIKRPDYPTGEVYTWSQLERKWKKTGDLMDDPNEVPEKKELNGKYYDQIIDVAVDDGTANMRLGYNNGENEWEAAQRFILENADRGVRQDHLAQIAEFISKNVGGSTMEFNANQNSDPLTGGGRYIPGSAAPGFGGGAAVSEFAKEAARRAAEGQDSGESYRDTYQRLQGQQVAVSEYAKEALRLEEEARRAAGNATGAAPLLGSDKYPLIDMATFPQPVNAAGCQKKITEFLGLVDDNGKLSEAEQTTLTTLLAFASGANKDPSSVSGTEWMSVVSKLLAFPNEKRFPAVDIVRCVVREQSLCDQLVAEHKAAAEDAKAATILGQLFTFFKESTSAVEATLVCRALCNMFGTATAYIAENSATITDSAKIVFKMTPNARTALASVVQNFCVHFSKVEVAAEAGPAESRIVDLVPWCTQWLLYESTAPILMVLLASVGTLICSKSSVNKMCLEKAKECYLADCLKGKTQFGDSGVMSLAGELVEKYLSD
eukprot:TRINITY_DN59499_c0_g1_i1.p1 TRINITY_DN59499_c0_g1~~TRINITY_DN59499_c0_g1_i1.p1  ORF type:complete len:849 (+),score=80.33 TRINITY_DN59499_c0_g1_i1:49-2547(+)